MGAAILMISNFLGAFVGLASLLFGASWGSAFLIYMLGGSICAVLIGLLVATRRAQKFEQINNAVQYN